MGLEPIVPVHRSTNANILISNKISGEDNKQEPDIDTTPVPMDLEPELGQLSTNTNSESISTTQVDLESELREFLEGGAGSLATADDVGIEQMLMD